MNKEQLEKRILEVVQTMVMSDIQVTITDFLVDVGFDSLTKVDLILCLEDEFDIEFCDEDLQPRKLKSIKDLVSIVGGYLNIGGVEKLRW